jgi:hypothetical protein
METVRILWFPYHISLILRFSWYGQNGTLVRKAYVFKLKI